MYPVTVAGPHEAESMKLKVDNIENWILVTGMIRSATTLVGRVLSFPWSVDYIHEPFNGGYRPPDQQPFEPRYVRPERDDAEAHSYSDHLAPLFRYNLALNTTHHPDDPWYKKLAKQLVGSRGPVYLQLAKLNLWHRATIIKDPLAKLPAEFLHVWFSVTPVVVVRHPVSLASSLQRVGWYPETKDFASQPQLVEDYFADDPDFLQRKWPSRFLESMGHWRATYKMLLAQADRYDWPVVTHEALSQNPVAEFKQLYEVLDLPWSGRVARKVQQMTGGGNSAEARGGQAMDLQRDSARIFEMRRDAISQEKRRAIFEVVKDVALKLYSHESFAI